jgi:phosphoribosylamine-glycine ligase
MEYEYRNRIGNDVDYILQKAIDGIEISTEGWWDGKEWKNFNHTIEDKRLMNGNLGMAIGSQNNTVWLKKNPNGLLIQELKKITPFIKSSGYVGPFDWNCIVRKEDKKPYYLETTSRLGYDAFYCLMELLKDPLFKFWTNEFESEFWPGFASSARVSIPPFPYYDEDLLEDMARDTIIKGRLDDYPQFWGEDVYLKDGKLACAGSDGIIGVVANRGNSIGGAWGNVYRDLDRLKVGSYMQYRTDGPKRSQRAFDTLKSWGIEIE